MGINDSFRLIARPQDAALVVLVILGFVAVVPEVLQVLL